MYGCVSKSSWGTRTCWQRAACWSQFPEAQRCLRGFSQSARRCQEAQQPMPALDLRRTSLSTVTSDLHRHQTLRKSLCPSPLTSPLSGLQRFSIPSLLTNFLSLLAPPTTRTRALEWRRQQFASITCTTEERVCHVPLMVSGKVVPLLERGEGARPEVYLKASWSWDPDSRWTDEMFKHVILWNVRGILQGKKSSFRHPRS